MSKTIAHWGRVRVVAVALAACTLVACSGSDDAGSTAAGVEAPAGTKTFVNSMGKLDGSLAENYVDFSFAYPEAWTLDPETGQPGASNFVKVEHNLDGNFTVENFAVGYFTGSGSKEGDEALMPMLASQISSQFAPGFPNYRELSQGKTQIGPYEGYELRFESTVPDTPKGTIEIWARAVMLPIEGSNKGVTLIMMATNLSDEVEGIDDVGVKGELPIILESLKLGK